MAKKHLREILPLSYEEAELRWQTAIPLVSNPFLLMETSQLALVGASIVFISLCVGLWLTEGGLAVEDAVILFKTSVLIFLATLVCFAAVALCLFRNRYFGTYRADASGLYYEGSRGKDERREIFVHVKAMPVLGRVAADKTHSRFLPWEKAGSFIDIPSMRVIILKRSFWHMLRLYTPDNETHEQVIHYLKQKIKNKTTH